MTDAEQKTLHLSWLMAQIYYQLLCAPILDEEGNIDRQAVTALTNAKNAFHQLEVETKKMDGEYSSVGGLIWNQQAKTMLIIGFAVMGFLIAFGGLFAKTNLLRGLLIILDSAVACPIFFIYKDLGPGNLYTFRQIRIFIAILLFVLICILI